MHAQSRQKTTELISLIKTRLFTSVVGDVMDSLGLTHQFLPPEISALRPDMIVCGRAMTALQADCASTNISAEGKNAPFGLLFEALDSLKENDVYVATGASESYACWGELMTTRALQLGAVGAVLNGFSRDTHGISKLNFPTFSTGRYGQDQYVRGRVIDYNCPLEFPNHTRVDPGDLILGDMDGVVAIPRLREKEILELSLEKAGEENKVKEAIMKGMSATEAWSRFGFF
jgi:regulator of RNase E activity RraA